MKKFLASVICFLLIFTTGVSIAETLEERISALEKKVEILEGKQQGEPESSLSSVAEDDVTDTTTPFFPRQTVTVKNFAEFTLNKIAYSNKVNPPHPGDYYQYYAVENAENSFIDLTVSVKNLTTTIEDVTNLLSVVIVYDGNYEYKAQAAIESSGGKDLEYSIISGISPLNSETARFFVELPKEAVNNKSKLSIRITVGGKTFVTSGDWK